jgi:hypothetical protein
MRTAGPFSLAASAKPPSKNWHERYVAGGRNNKVHSRTVQNAKYHVSCNQIPGRAGVAAPPHVYSFARGSGSKVADMPRRSIAEAGGRMRVVRLKTILFLASHEPLQTPRHRQAASTPPESVSRTGFFSRPRFNSFPCLVFLPLPLFACSAYFAVNIRLGFWPPSVPCSMLGSAPNWGQRHAGRNNEVQLTTLNNKPINPPVRPALPRRPLYTPSPAGAGARWPTCCVGV